LRQIPTFLPAEAILVWTPVSSTTLSPPILTHFPTLCLHVIFLKGTKTNKQCSKDSTLLEHSIVDFSEKPFLPLLLGLACY